MLVVSELIEAAKEAELVSDEEDDEGDIMDIDVSLNVIHA